MDVGTILDSFERVKREVGDFPAGALCIVLGRRAKIGVNLCPVACLLRVDLRCRARDCSNHSSPHASTLSISVPCTVRPRRRLSDSQVEKHEAGRDPELDDVRSGNNDCW